MKFLDYLYIIPKNLKIIYMGQINNFIYSSFMLIQVSKDLKKVFVETFCGQEEGFVVKRDEEVYDDFYAGIYDDLVLTPSKNNYELDQVISITKMNSNSNVLDVGSGTGHHVNSLNTKGITCEGLDNFKAMVNKAKKVISSSNFKHGDVTIDDLSTRIIYSYNMFLLYDILFTNKMPFFQNCFKWLNLEVT